MKSELNRAASVAAIMAVAAPAWAATEDVKRDEIIVTASPLERTVEETIVGTTVISEEELQDALENSIGETLRRQPGISSTFFGPGSSRPIIRGLAGDRIRVLDSGIGTIDASTTSPDHAPAVSSATATQVEIVRGPATLLYGSSAAGGVVNVLNGRIPRALPEDGIDGALRIGGSTVDEGVEAAGGFDINLGKFGNGALVFHGEGFYREAEDFNIPGFAESEQLRALEALEGGDDDEEEEEVFGVAENSALETVGGSAGLSYIFDNGFIGISASAFDTVYGVPGGHEEGEEEGGEEEEEEGGIIIDIEQRRFDLDGEIEQDFLLFQKAKFRFGYADFEQLEFEGPGEVGTVFTNEGFEGRLELISKERTLLGGDLNGAIGFQFRGRDFSAIGEEAFVPPTETFQYGFFGLKELETGPFRFEVGARYESTNHEVVETGFTRDFDAFSVSGGVGYTPVEGVFFGASGFRTERAPSIEELFSDGPHLAISAFELGNPDFGLETALGVEGTARYSNDRFSVSVNGFYTSYDEFIFEDDTGEIEDGLPVFQFFASDAEFRGFEAETEVELFRVGQFDIHLDGHVEFVRATVAGTATGNLPRIPPLGGLVGLGAKSKHLDLRAELDAAVAQDNISEFELPTDGYQLVNLSATWRPVPDRADLAVRFIVSNVGDEEARLHTSFLSDVVPLPGRNFRVSLRGAF